MKADEKEEEENFEQDTTIPQIYPFVWLHTTAYHTIHAGGHDCVIPKSPSPPPDAVQ